MSKSLREWGALALLLWLLWRRGGQKPFSEVVTTTITVADGVYHTTESGETWFETSASHELGPGVWFRVDAGGNLVGPV